MQNIRDINPLEHLTSDMAKSRFNYEAILNGIVEWSNSKLDEVTVRLATDTAPFFVDYTFPTKRSYAGEAKGLVDPGSTAHMFSYISKYDIPALYSPDVAKCDSIKIRLTVKDTGGATWSLYADTVIYDEPGTVSTRDYCDGLYVRMPVNGAMTLCMTVRDVHKGDQWSVLPLSKDPGSNWMQVVEQFNAGHGDYYADANGALVEYNGKVYRVAGAIDTTRLPSTIESGWAPVCDILYRTDTVLHNMMYYYSGEFYLYTGIDSDIENILPPHEDNAHMYWLPRAVYFERLFAVTSTSTFRWRVDTDISGLVLRQDTAPATQMTVPDIAMACNIEINSGSESDNAHKGVSIFESCNYSLWPSSDNAVWTNGAVYGTDMTVPSTSVQDYTAQMMFHHADPAVKTMNIINYDGPDLDQGLAIYLPVRDKVLENGSAVYKEPCDGYTFEFMFRIWPNPGYNGHTTPDLTINKAHIYVYSADSSDSLYGVAPIAKFSMARLTNFYVFAENIGVPNRPVIYKARFVYSAKAGAWETYDYYQLPDHIFLSPKGFVDPSDRRDDPYGVETAGFPLFQDPFSGLDLSRIMVDDEYRNRME